MLSSVRWRELLELELRSKHGFPLRFLICAQQTDDLSIRAVLELLALRLELLAGQLLGEQILHGLVEVIHDRLHLVQLILAHIQRLGNVRSTDGLRAVPLQRELVVSLVLTFGKDRLDLFFDLLATSILRGRTLVIATLSSRRRSTEFATTLATTRRRSLMFVATLSTTRRRATRSTLSGATLTTTARRSHDFLDCLLLLIRQLELGAHVRAEQKHRATHLHRRSALSAGPALLTTTLTSGSGLSHNDAGEHRKCCEGNDELLDCCAYHCFSPSQLILSAGDFSLATKYLEIIWVEKFLVFFEKSSPRCLD